MTGLAGTVLAAQPGSLLILLLILSGVVMAGLRRHFRRRSRTSWRKCRHHRYRMQAAGLLERLPELPTDAQRFGYLRKINPYVFEEVLLLSFERLGYRVIHNTRYSHDGGIDGQVLINNQRYLVQAKRYRHAINPAHVREFASLLRASGCAGFFIHTGRTGKKSRQLEKQYPHLQIISGERLLTLLAGRIHFQPAQCAMGSSFHQRREII